MALLVWGVILVGRGTVGDTTQLQPLRLQLDQFESAHDSGRRSLPSRAAAVGELNLALGQSAAVVPPDLWKHAGNTVQLTRPLQPKYE